FGLNQEEKAFVAENQTWRAIIDDEVAPLFYLENGVESGVAVSFLNKIAKETGVKIEYVKRDKAISLSEQMKRDNIQIVVGRSTSDVDEKTENLILTTPFVDGNFSLVSTKDFNLDKREGKVCATQHYAKLLKTEKPSKVIRTDTVDDVIELILSGKADYGIVSACSIQYALNNGFYPNIRFVSMADNHVSATYAVSKDADLKIVSIINKAILAYAAEDVPMYLNERMVNSTRKLSVKNLI
ncbi:MAG: transporter substrate-binding domain-containing protein, partial [Clostridia bacterium]